MDQNIDAGIALPASPIVVRVYVDDGVSKQGALVLMETITRCFPDVAVKSIDAIEVILGAWVSTTTTLVIPGGADLPYCSKLDGQGTDTIRGFVESGGRFLGICAGAYFGANECRFHEGDPRGFEVVGPRKLAFYPAAAVGPALAPYYYNSHKGARVAVLTTLASGSETRYAYCNGGCYFEDPAVVDPALPVRVLARYLNDDVPSKGRPAAVECRFGRGLAVLLGVHAETSPLSLDHGIALDQDPASVAQLRDHVIPLLQRAGGQAHTDALFVELVKSSIYGPAC